ncbi:hypothetical protein DL93DRAFT_2158507 [Clavulina sp. PMI_390]|nr:hypothetical protein DL93DRAFT_2158507 [Clavulina sp. PMI_390]
MQSDGPYTKRSLVSLPFEIFVRILGEVDMISLIKLSWTCKEFNAFVTTDRYLWQLVVQKQLYNELIPLGSLPLSEMSLFQLFLCATRKSRLFHYIRQNREGVNCRRIDIHLSLPDGPEYFEFHIERLHSPKLVPGGRYILGHLAGRSTSLICCWDLHMPPTQNGTMLPAATLLPPRTEESPLHGILPSPGRSLQDGTFPFAAYNKTSEIAIFQLHTPPTSAPTLNIAAIRKWGRYCTPTSIVGDWVIIQGDPQGGEGDFIWNWKIDHVEQLSSAPGCALLTSWGVLAPIDISLIPEQPEEQDASNETLSLTIRPFRLESTKPVSGTASVEQNQSVERPSATRQISQSPSASVVSSIYSTTGTKTTFGHVAKSILHSADEARFFIDEARHADKAWEQRMFSIQTPFEISCSDATGTSQDPVDFIEWHNGLCEWGSPSGLPLDVRGRAETALNQSFLEIETLSRPETIRHTPAIYGLPSCSVVPKYGAILEPQEPFFLQFDYR